MDNTFEQKILAYLDGLLDARSESAFLKEVSHDTDKQRLLRQYRQLHERLSDRSRPVAVPLRAQQALAQSIPALKEVVPGTPLPAAVAVGSAGRLSWSTRRLVSLIALGGLLIGTITVLSLVQNTGEPLSADSGQRGGNAATVNTEGRARMTTDPNPSTTPREFRAAAEFRPEAAAAVKENTPDRQMLSADVSGRAADLIDAARSPFGAGDRTRPAPPLTMVETPAYGSGEAELQPLVFLTHPASGSTGFIHDGTLPPLSPPDLFSGRLHLCLETGAAQFGASGSVSDRSGLTGVYLAALRYDVSPAFTAGFELGQSRFARQKLGNHRSALNENGEGEIIVVDRVLISEFQSWLRAHGVYSFQPENRFRFEADAGAGLLLNTDRAVLLSCGLSAVYSLSTVLQARAGLHYSGTWLSPAAAEPLVIIPGDGVIGVIRNASTAEQVFSSSVEFRIGFGVLIW